MRKYKGKVAGPAVGGEGR